jgi:hypothetical protein
MSGAPTPGRALAQYEAALQARSHGGTYHEIEASHAGLYCAGGLLTAPPRASRRRAGLRATGRRLRSRLEPFAAIDIAIENLHLVGGAKGAPRSRSHIYAGRDACSWVWPSANEKPRPLASLSGMRGRSGAQHGSRCGRRNRRPTRRDRGAAPPLSRRRRAVAVIVLQSFERAIAHRSRRPAQRFRGPRWHVRLMRDG